MDEKQTIHLKDEKGRLTKVVSANGYMIRIGAENLITIYQDKEYVDGPMTLDELRQWAKQENASLFTIELVYE